MSQQYTTDAGTLIIPQAVASFKVQAANSGLATNGVLLIVGEADAGPRFDLEDSLQDNAFGPDQVGDIIAKYKSGPLVDAVANAAQAANDPNILGAFSRIIPVKTNASEKAKSALTVYGGGAYQSAGASAMYLADRSYGKLGNLIYYTIDTKVAEVLPTTGAFTLLLPNASTNISLRANGGAELPLTLAAAETPAAIVAAIDGLAGIAATGGTDRTIISNVSGSLSFTVIAGNAVQIDYNELWDGTPVIGDTLYIPAGSPIAGGASQNVGSYVVTGASTNQILATKLLDGSGAPGALTAPITIVGAQLVVAVTDVKVYAPVTITLEAGNPGLGYGKTLEVNELTTGVGLLSDLCYTLNTSKVSWVSKAGAAKLVVSGAEYAVTLNVTRQRDGITEALSAGGEIALKVGYTGTTATLTISDSALTTTVTGGAGGNISIDLKDFPTINDVATFINSQTGYTASVGNAILGQLPSTALDNVTTLGICSTFGEKDGRVKIDAYRFFNKVSESVLVQLQDATPTVLQAGAGLPQPVTALTYLAGGTKGGTTDTDIIEALAALEKVRGNFVVPLFSRDATNDKADLLTETASTYTIDSIIANTRAHVVKMSALKKRKNRQAFPSIKSTFVTAKETASNVASFRCAVPFQDIRNPNAAGVMTQFQPWMGGVIAAAMQAAGFYKAIVGKFANIAGALQAAKDFDPEDDTQLEEALLAGLLPLKKAETGGWKWVSDQTSYGVDNNFLFNSIQATYAADIIAMTTAQRMERAFVGQSAADISVSLAVAFLETIMDDFRRLKLIAPSDDAPNGYKNIKIKVAGTALVVSFEVKLAGAIYFVPISFLVSQVEQTA